MDKVELVNVINEEDVIKARAKENIQKWSRSKSISSIDTITKNVILQPKNKYRPLQENSNVILNSSTKRSQIQKYLISDSNSVLKLQEIVNEKNLDLNDAMENFEIRCKESREQLSRFGKQIDTSLYDLNTVTVNLACVREKTDLLDSTSRNLVEDQASLLERHEHISDHLKYFLQIESMRRKLYHTNYLITNNQSFYETLDKIDDGIKYMSHHPTFKESSKYLQQYKSFLCGALSLIKYYISNVLNSINSMSILPASAEAETANKSGELNPEVSSHYGKFKATAFKIQPLIHQVEVRCSKFSEYEVLLDQIQQMYVEKRYELMQESVANSVRAVVVSNKNDRSHMFRTACSLFILVCQDEHQLFCTFFSTSSEHLYNYLGNICSLLYDHLRPIIVQIEHTEILCELCTILKSDFLVNIENENRYLEPFHKVIVELSNDIQERLVFRSHLYFRMDILNYEPSSGDLAYPDKLQMMLDIVNSTDQFSESRQDLRAKSSTSVKIIQSAQDLKSQDSKSQDSRSSTSSSKTDLQRTESQQSIVSQSSQMLTKPMSVSDLQGMWYPTIRRTLQCLSRLYRCLDVRTFQGLSQEAISFCVISIIRAGDQINTRSSPLDGYLFQISHLLILREQIAAFQVDFTTRETKLDFSKAKEAASNIIHRKNLFTMGTNNAILKLLIEGAPEVVEHILDSKKDADIQLKVACQKLIAHVTKMLIEPLEQLNNWLQETRRSKNFHPASFRTLEWSAPENLSLVVSTVTRNIKTKLYPVQRSMTLYIHNKETEAILFRPIKNNIIGAFVQLEQLLSECYYTLDELVIIGCPSADQVSLMLSLEILKNSQDSPETTTESQETAN